MYQNDKRTCSVRKTIFFYTFVAFSFLPLNSLSMTFTANGKRQTVGSCMSQKLENLSFSTCLILLRSYSMCLGNRQERSFIKSGHSVFWKKDNFILLFAVNVMLTSLLSAKHPSKMIELLIRFWGKLNHIQHFHNGGQIKYYLVLMLIRPFRLEYNEKKLLFWSESKRSNYHRFKKLINRQQEPMSRSLHLPHWVCTPTQE